MDFIILSWIKSIPLKIPLTEVQEDLKKLRDIRYWVRKATPGTEESKEPPVVIDPLSGYDTGTPSGWMATNALMAASDPRFAGAFWDAIDERGGLMRK